MPYKNTELLQESRKRSRQKLKDQVIQYLKSHPCIDCGEDKIAVLEFDHRDSTTKEDTISNIMHGGGLEHLVREIEKCDVRCINCHRIRHNASSMRFRGNPIVLEHLRSHPCIDCGQSNLALLDFDHKDPKEKIAEIARMAADRAAKNKIISEIDKCDVRCAKCHRLRHIQDKSVFLSESISGVMSLESREKIRQSKLGRLRSEETKAKVSAALMGNHCRKIKDLTGKTFGQLTVLRQGQIKPITGGTRVYWWCQCSCGSPEKEIAGIKLTTGCTKSCSCLRKIFVGNQNTRVRELDSVDKDARIRFSANPSKCYQRHIREIFAERDASRDTLSLDSAVVCEISYQEASALILQYEWLGTMGAGITRSFGLKINGKLVGAVCFNRGNTPESRNVCGQEYADKTLCLTRGACIPEAPKNSASYLIRRAVKACYQQGYEIFFAYSDFDAGEVGTIYQALGWKYIGSGDKKKYHSDFIDTHGKTWSSYKLSSWRPRLRKEFNIPEYMPVNTYLQSIGWKKVNRPLKGKYVWFEGKNRSELEKLCLYPFLSYPKRRATEV